MTRTVTLVTHEGAPNGAPEDQLLARAVTSLGGNPRIEVWTDPAVDWSKSSVTAVRSTWDYHLRHVEWTRWVQRVSQLTELVNAPELLTWNSEKTYLFELESRGVRIVPTILVDDSCVLIDECAARAWVDIVVKPTIGASSFGARRFSGAELWRDATDYCRAMQLKGRVLVQPYQCAIEIERERSLVYIEGAFGHAFTKPGFHADSGNAVLKRHHPLNAELEFAEQVLAALPSRPSVARIDLLPSMNGTMLMEAELIEPQLGLHFCESTLDRLAKRLVS